jgi:LysM repeat protein
MRRSTYNNTSVMADGAPYYNRPNTRQCPHGTMPYTVKRGDTLYSIAIDYGTSIDAIMAVNPGILDPNIIYEGQQICLPYEQTCDGFLYTIKPGETLYSIAMMFNISLDELLAANPQINPNYYLAGEVICIPQSYPCPGIGEIYVIKPDDTLTSILENCRVSLAALLAANPGFDPNNIVKGSSLCVVPTPCEPLCDESVRRIVPPECRDIHELAKKLCTTTDALLMANPAYSPCYFIPGHPFCCPPGTAHNMDVKIEK